jgi:hypothetical protein
VLILTRDGAGEGIDRKRFFLSIWFASGPADDGGFRTRHWIIASI